MVVIVFAVLIGIGFLANRAKTNKLRSLPSGATRLETVKSGRVNQTVKQYAATGWSLDTQTSAKSLGSQARVTMTFRKR
jgi:hypothetical protein